MISLGGLVESNTLASNNKRLPLFVFVLSLLVSFVASGIVLFQAIHSAQFVFNRQSEIITERIQRGLLNVQHVLQAGKGLYVASREVDRGEWRSFVNALDLPAHVKGVLGMGFAQRVSFKDKDAHEAAVRSEGFPKYKIWPEPATEDLFPILFLEPFDERNQRAFGFNMYSDSERRQAMDRAWENDQAALSGKVVLVQDSDHASEYGFLVYLPIYSNLMPHTTAAEKRSALSGFVYCPVRVKDFVESALRTNEFSVDFQIYSGKETKGETFLYGSAPEENFFLSRLLSRFFNQSRPFFFAGQTWTLSFHAKSDFYNLIDKKSAAIVFTGGILTSCLFALLAWYQVTLRDRAADMAEKMTAELSSKMAELEKAHEEVKQAQDKAVQSGKMAAVGTLLAGVTHELNNKIAPILGYVELFKAAETNEKKLRQLDIVEQAAIQAKGIVEDMLAFSRPEKSSQALFDLRDAADNTVRLYQTELHRLNVEIEWQKPVDPVPVLGSEKQLSQVFLNILKNACDASMHAQKKKITVKLYETAGRATVEFRDYGTGMTSETALRIFDPFFTTKREGQGTGLGLSVSHGIVQSHGGTIRVESKLGEGSSFFVELPVAAEEFSGSPARSEPRVRIVPEGIAVKKIWIIEDSDHVRRILTDFLENCGFRSLTCFNCAEKAWEKLRSEGRPDLILSDLRMPGMGGMAFYDKARKDFPSIKVLVITGDTFDPQVSDFLTSRKPVVLYKPFHLGSALKIIENALNMKAA